MVANITHHKSEATEDYVLFDESIQCYKVILQKRQQQTQKPNYEQSSGLPIYRNHRDRERF